MRTPSVFPASIRSALRVTYRLWRFKQRYGLTWAEALNRGVYELEKYEELDRRYEQQREVKVLAGGPGGDGPVPELKHQY